ncbi:hypothetical protein FOZ60_002264 [Perkinsus olseni]|uniref:Methyltransferase FkbM domain-containing protein n=1 Tax=Perkinsus olseni TaxID=32597 RepID=A0A7J6NZD7_PEROL|nr:hypothetical protein FOZ60_002264 [Perkinsus olseni]
MVINTMRGMTILSLASPALTYTAIEAASYLSAISLEALRDGFTLDIEDLVPPLKLLYKGPQKSGIFLDIGAHLGNSTKTMLGDLDSALQALVHRNLLPQAPDETTVVVAFEALPWICNVLKRKAEMFGWQLLQPVHIECAAVAKSAGEATFYFNNPYGPTASILPKQRTSHLKNVTVPTRRVKDTLEEIDYAGLPVFLMKVDTEGMDGLIVEETLKDGIRPRIIIFEYSRMWMSEAVSIPLGDFSDRMQRQYGYYCFAATRLGVWAPLWGLWYTDLIDGVYSYGNVVCFICSDEIADFLSGQIHDPAARVFVVSDFLRECGLPSRDPESLYTELDRIYWGAVNGTASLEWHMASLATYRGDFATAYRWSDSAASKGQFDAEFLIGLQTYFGVNRRGVGNRERGIEWLKRASRKGHGGAAWFLSRIGYSLKHDY